MAEGRGIQVDTTKMKRDLNKLDDGIKRQLPRVAKEIITQTQERIQGKTPILTGALYDSVQVVDTGDGGAAITYGTGLGVYPWIQAARSGNLKGKITITRGAFRDAVEQMTARQVSSM